MIRTLSICLCFLSYLCGAEAPGHDFFPLQPGNQWVLEAEDDSKEILNVRVHRSKSVDGFTYYLVSGYAPGDVWIRQTPEGELFARNMESGVEEKIAHLSEGAHVYPTPLGGCVQEARPAGIELGIPESLRMNYEPGDCRDAGLTEEAYFLGVGLLSRTITTIRGAVTYHLAHARVGGQTIHENPKELLFHDRFSHGAAGWLAGFSDYALVNGDMHFVAEPRVLPDELGSEGQRGYFLQSMNRSDDMFMFLKKGLFLKDGLKPNQSYSLSYDILLASNAQTGCSGAGGAPGESVYLKAGASTDEAVPVAGPGQHLELNIDKGHQSQSGLQAGVVGSIENGDPCNPANSRYVRMRKAYEHGWPVRTDGRGQLWLVIGTDSAYEGLTGLFFESVTVRLRENEVSIAPAVPSTGGPPRGWPVTRPDWMDDKGSYGRGTPRPIHREPVR